VNYVYIFRIRQLFQTFYLSYTLPTHRATVYFMGIALSFVLQYSGRDFRLKKVCVRFEVSFGVTVNIVVSSVVTAYGSMFWDYLLRPSAWHNIKPHPYQTAFCRPTLSHWFSHKQFSQSSVPSIIKICFPHVSTIYPEEVGSTSLCNICIIVLNYTVSHVR
jgi:hypothetical protein